MFNQQNRHKWKHTFATWLSLQPWVSRCARDSRHLHGWAHGFGYCLDWPIRDKPPEIYGAECGHNLAGFRAIFDNYPRWWTLRGLTVIFRMLAHTLFTSLLLIVSRKNSVLLWICNDITDIPPNPCAQPWKWRESREHRETHGWILSLGKRLPTSEQLIVFSGNFASNVFLFQN